MKLENAIEAARIALQHAHWAESEARESRQAAQYALKQLLELQKKNKQPKK